MIILRSVKNSCSMKLKIRIHILKLMLSVIVSFGLFFKKEHVCTDLCCSRNCCNNQIPGVNKTVIIVKVYIDLMKKNHHQQNQQHLRLDEIFAFGSHVCFDLRFWFWMLDVHIIQQISVINCRIATVAYYKGMSSFFSNSHTVATRASAHFCGIFTAAPASHNSAPLVSPIHTIGSTNTDRVSKLYTGLTPLSLFSAFDHQFTWPNTVCTNELVRKNDPHYNSEEEWKRKGQVCDGGKNPHYTHIRFWTCDHDGVRRHE